jgi:dTDP-4-amino-4,6-dideoxygalactose transaminase
MYSIKQINKVGSVLKKNKTNYWTGLQCKNFEKKFSKYHNIKYSVAVSNGSVALEIALKALNLNKLDKVIVTPRSFVISASCVLNLGLVPIFADIDDNGNIKIEEIKRVFTKNVKAIIVVHLNGLSCDLDPIIKFVKKNNIYLIEDCSQAHGAVYKGKIVGSYGDISTWSFCQDKIISTGGEGGMVSTNNKKLWLKCWSAKDHGKNYKSVFNKKFKPGFRWLHDNMGSNYRMTEMQAVLGIEQLKILDKQIRRRNFIARLYINELKNYYQKYGILREPNFQCKTCPFKKNNNLCYKCTHAFYRLNLYINPDKINRNKLIKDLNQNKVSCGVGSCPEIYREKIFKRLKLQPKKRHVNAKLLGETSVMFPINPYRDLKKIRSEINTIKRIFKKYI